MEVVYNHEANSKIDEDEADDITLLKVQDVEGGDANVMVVKGVQVQKDVTAQVQMIVKVGKVVIYIVVR